MIKIYLEKEEILLIQKNKTEKCVRVQLLMNFIDIFSNNDKVLIN